MIFSEMDTNYKRKMEECCRTAEEFIKIYNETVDTKRHQISRLYLSNGLLVWNGNGTTGNENIQKYFENFPPTNRIVKTLDAQPIVKGALDENTFIFQACGTIKIDNMPPKYYQETFVITSNDNKWKIVSDCFRFQETTSLK